MLKHPGFLKPLTRMESPQERNSRLYFLGASERHERLAVRFVRKRIPSSEIASRNAATEEN